MLDLELKSTHINYDTFYRFREKLDQCDIFAMQNDVPLKCLSWNYIREIRKFQNSSCLRHGVPFILKQI